jgi:hypothetical protein
VGSNLRLTAEQYGRLKGVEVQNELCVFIHVRPVGLLDTIGQSTSRFKVLNYYGFDVVSWRLTRRLPGRLSFTRQPVSRLPHHWIGGEI